MDTPFLRSLSYITEAGTVALLPSPFATIVKKQERVFIYGPHAKVWIVPVDTGDTLVFCQPHFMKAILGHPRYFIDRQLSSEELPLLLPFLEVKTLKEWERLFVDAREAVSETADEQQFERLWGDFVAANRTLLLKDSTLQRQAERLCLRYAGQSPLMVLRQKRLAEQFERDITTGKYQPSTYFADQSHYIREAKNLTDYTPQYWLKMSATFYSWNGTSITL